MAFVKVALFLSLLVVVAYASSEKRDEHNIDACEGDQTVNYHALSTTVEKKGRFLQIQKGTLSFPEFGSGKKPITCIMVTDLMDSGTGGYPDILNGGVSFYNVLLQFTSQRSKGYKFRVDIYTEP
ncbi:uncharacterized protein CBL_10801 [Carabus blaptoides fortunei]